METCHRFCFYTREYPFKGQEFVGEGLNLQKGEEREVKKKNSHFRSMLLVTLIMRAFLHLRTGAGRAAWTGDRPLVQAFFLENILVFF